MSEVTVLEINPCPLMLFSVFNIIKCIYLQMGQIQKKKALHTIEKANYSTIHSIILNHLKLTGLKESK